MGCVDCGLGLDTKTSPRCAAIEKAQAELRHEYDVREERRRELDFLEKGGNPLDFKFGHATSISLKSTSFTDQRAEQYVRSEAKGSFALAASPHGDSIESSGRPGEFVGRETNTADNLLLFDGENSNSAGEKNVKRAGKRRNASLIEQSSEGAGCSHAKETENSLIFHLGVKNQAYARRNRSRSSRDSHGNKSTVPSSFSDHRNGNRSIRETRSESHGASHVSNSKPASPKGNVVSKASTTDNRLDIELDGVQTHQASADKIKDGVRVGEAEVNISETVQNINQSNQHNNPPREQVAKDEATSVDFCSVSLEPTGNVKDISNFERINGSNVPDKDVTDVLDDDIGSMAEFRRLNYVKTDTRAEKENITAGNTNSENCCMVKSEECRSNGDSKESSVYQKTKENKGMRENVLSMGVEAPITATNEPRSVPSMLSNSTIRIKDEVELCENGTELKTREIVSNPERKLNNSLRDGSHSINKKCVTESNLVVPTCEPSTTTLSKRGTSTTSAVQNNSANQLKLGKKAREEAILKEARIIEVNLKRTAQLSSSYKSSEKQRKCHWDFVLEEMAWMANDFMQERLWKTVAAAHICHRIASGGQSKFEQEIIHRKQRNIARTLAKIVMGFWHSAAVFLTTGEALNGLNGECISNLFKSCKVNGEAEKHQGNKDEAGDISVRPSIEGYAVRFLKYDCRAPTHHVLAEAPPTPEIVNDAGILEKSGEGELSEESLFYTVQPGAIQVYREAVEFQCLNYKKIVNPMNQEDCYASACDSLPDGPRKNEYEEEEGETGSYFLPGAFESAMSSKFTLKKKKIFQQKHVARSYNFGSDFSYESCLEGKSANRPLMGKRPSSTPNAGRIPTKRVRTAARQRVVSPFGAQATGSLQTTNKTDVSSGDTNSFQDDQCSMHGGTESRKNMEVESTADFEKQFPFNDSEACTKSKKKSKHFAYSTNLSDSGVLVASGKASVFDQRFQADSTVQQEQRDQVKKRLEIQHHESNGNIGVYGQHASKKPKLLRHLTEPSQEAIVPGTGSMPSPVASQMSNMSNQNKFIKLIANRDRGKKSKAMKMAAGQSGSGISWTTFEDQALVVFVHDMGPNWELVSDAINNTLQFKCTFRKPKECKERHKFLMDKSAGDGADSAEDSGSSQPYPSTLPGIPKGSASKLFQHLQGPMEEDTLKAHFKKIILIGHKLHSCQSQKDTQELKQMTPVHSSHFVALSQTCPNNLGGGVLSPLDLCDAISSSPDVLTLGYHDTHASGAIPSHQGSPSPVLSTSSSNTMLPGSSGIVLGSNLPSPSTPLNAPARDAQRYCMPRAASLHDDNQQKMHYSQMLSSRNIQLSSLSVPGALPVGVDRAAHMLPGGNGMGMMGSRTMPMSRPGFQGLISPGMPMVPKGSMLAGGGGGVPNSVNVHPGAVSGPGNSMLRPRAGQNTQDYRHMMAQGLQMQVSQGNGQAVPPFSAMSAPFSTTTALPSAQLYPVQQHQKSHQVLQQPYMLGNPHHHHIQGVNHSNSQQQAYAIHLAKERQNQQRMMPQSQQPYSPSAMSPVHSSSQLQQQTQSSSCVTPIPSQAQHNKQQMVRNSQASSGMPNQIMKQRQRQQAHPQQPRHQQQPKQLLQQQAKLVKGLSGGPMLMHQNLTVDPSQVSGMPAASRNQVSENHLMQQGPGLPGLNSTLPHSSNHHKLYSRPPPQSSKQIPQLASHSDTYNQNPPVVPSNHTLTAPQQPPHPSSIPVAAPSPPQQQRQINQNKQRMMIQQNPQPSSDGRVQSSGDQVQVNQMIPATSLPGCTDSASSRPLVSSAMQWKPEPSYDTSSPTPTTHLAGSPPGNLVGADTLVSSSSEGSALRQFSGSVSMDGHCIGGQWRPQQQSQPLLQLQQQPPPQHPHEEGVQHNLYV